MFWGAGQMDEVMGSAISGSHRKLTTKGRNRRRVVSCMRNMGRVPTFTTVSLSLAHPGWQSQRQGLQRGRSHQQRCDDDQQQQVLNHMDPEELTRKDVDGSRIADKSKKQRNH